MINHSKLPSLSKKALNDAPKENRYAVSENLSDRFSSEGYYCFETQERGMNAIFILIGLYLHEGPKKNYLTDKSYGEKQLSEFKSKYKDK